MLPARNGAMRGKYQFQIVTTQSNSGNFDAVMIAECKKIGMKPICDHPSYCKNDANSIYIGQNHHIAYPPHRNNDSYFPAGWKDVRTQKLSGDFCTYTARANGNHALCSA